MSRSLVLVITGDIISSKKRHSALEAQNIDFDHYFKAQLQGLNSDLKGKLGLERMYFPSQGDAFQIFLFIEPDFNFAELIFYTLYHLRPFDVRLGLGFGLSGGRESDVERDGWGPETIYENSWEMNGEVFWAAKRALDRISGVKHSALALEISGGTMDNKEHLERDGALLEVLQLYLGQIGEIILNWKPETWEDLYNVLINGDVQGLAQSRNITVVGFYKRIQRSQYKLFVQMLDALKGLLFAL